MTTRPMRHTSRWPIRHSRIVQVTDIRPTPTTVSGQDVELSCGHHFTGNPATWFPKGDWNRCSACEEAAADAMASEPR